MTYCQNCKHFTSRGSEDKGYYAVCKLTRLVTIARAYACEDFSRVKRPVIKYNCGKRK